MVYTLSSQYYKACTYKWGGNIQLVICIASGHDHKKWVHSLLGMRLEQVWPAVLSTKAASSSLGHGETCTSSPSQGQVWACDSFCQMKCEQEQEVETLRPRMWFPTHVFPLPWCWPHSSGCSVCVGPGGGRSPSWPTMDSAQVMELWGLFAPAEELRSSWLIHRFYVQHEMISFVSSFILFFVPTYIMHLLCKRLKRNGIEKVSSKGTQDYIMCVCI